MSSARFQALCLLALATLSLAQNDCTITLPDNFLSATGLATPYLLSGCDQRQVADQSTFVEAAILDTATGNLSVYHPLVVNKGDVEGTDFITPTPVTLPQSAVVALWFGTNAGTLTLAGNTTGCVNGAQGSIFGQVAYCNAPAFFTAANNAISAGQLNIAAPGTSTTIPGEPCIAGTRDFRMVDMDQSDNVVTTYLLIDGKVLAQNTPENAKNNSNAAELTNGSDNALLDDFLQPILGCSSMMVPSLTAPTGQTKALALNELLSQVHPPQTPALVPENDPMVVDNNGNPDLGKLNLYRAGMGQPAAASLADANGTTYCQNFAAAGIFTQQNAKLFAGGTSPNPATGNNLFTFMANRFAASFGPVPALGCETLFGLADSPVAQASDSAGVVTSASINTVLLSSILNGQITAGGNAASAASATASTTTIASVTTTTRAGRVSITRARSTTSAVAAASSLSSTTSAVAAVSNLSSTTGRHRARPSASSLSSGGGATAETTGAADATSTAEATSAAETTSAAASDLSSTTGRHRTRPSASSLSGGGGAKAEATSTAEATSAAETTSAAVGTGGKSTSRAGCRRRRPATTGAYDVRAIENRAKSTGSGGDPTPITTNGHKTRATILATQAFYA